MAERSFTPNEPGAARNVASWLITHGNHESYQIDVSWPLTWSSRKDESVANVLYLVDGNALFLTATETIRRCEAQSHRRQSSEHQTGTIVVAVGYPLTDTVFSPRRSYDLTPLCPPKQYTPLAGPDGKPKSDETYGYGGADGFLSFITGVVQPFIQTEAFPRVTFARTAIFGHSYGGLFVLHTLFTRPSSFDIYLAASPSIWWSDRFILSEAERFCTDSLEPGRRPVFWMSYGSREQAPVQGHGELPERFQIRQEAAGQRRMADNCRDLEAMLLDRADGRFRAVEIREFADEDHGSVIAPALNGAIEDRTGRRTVQEPKAAHGTADPWTAPTVAGLGDDSASSVPPTVEQDCETNTFPHLDIERMTVLLCRELSWDKSIVRIQTEIEFLQMKSKNAATGRSSPNCTAAPGPPHEHEPMKRLPPPKKVCDHLLSVYSATFERICRVLHLPSFRRQYEEFWSYQMQDHDHDHNHDLNQPTMPSAVVPQLTTVLTIGAQIADSDTRDMHAATYQILTTDGMALVHAWLEKLHGKQQTELTAIQARALVLLAQTRRCDGLDKLWTASTALLRRAKVSNRHLDPPFIPNLTAFEREMRRRLWVTIVALGIQASVLSSIPLIIPIFLPLLFFPSLIEDSDFDESSQKIPSDDAK
ncbi:Alpha/Beta hydrolase protein [Aspergillus multicolor]|uniref:Alpha/Beta hydrolase protein n=1 Tax=Aspergillus multicolor TaxID=41759 RepID=UPI003CCDFC0F